jgi:ABC-type sugar transport system ATPase subunit
VSSAALEIRGLHKRFGGIEATANVSLSIAKGSLHALIGPNGAGKTTLVAQLSGELTPNSGEILHRGTDVTALDMFRRCRRGIARSFQITSLFDDYTALENVLLAVLSRHGRGPRFWNDVMGDHDSIREAELVLDEGMPKPSVFPHEFCELGFCHRKRLDTSGLELLDYLRVLRHPTPFVKRVTPVSIWASQRGRWRNCGQGSQ